MQISGTSHDRSIAILPFVNMSPDPDNEYFSDGITEEIINALAKIEQLKVTSRTSSFYFKNKQLPIREIAQQLKVSTLLEGSIRVHKDSIRITAQLIQANEDYHFWSETWDRKLENIFAIQDEISLLIADKLREHFGHFEIQERLIEAQTASIPAYEYSLQARFYFNKWNPQDAQKAISLYERALEIDPDHAQSYVGLGKCYGFLATTGFLAFDEAWDKSYNYTSKAQELNNQLSEVHYQLGNRAFFIEGDFNKSLKALKQAIMLNPNNAEAQQFISLLYIISGQQEKAQEHLKIASNINPLSEETRFYSAYFHYMIEDYEKALALLNACLEVNEKNIPVHFVKAMTFLKLGRYEEVIPYYDQIPQEIVIPHEKSGALCLAYALKKEDKKAFEYLEQLKVHVLQGSGFTADAYIFMYYANTGQTELAFEWVEKALREKASMLLLRFCDPMLSPLRTDPRYSSLKHRIYPSAEESLKSPAKKALLSEGNAAYYAQLLKNHLNEFQPYLDPALSLRTLAEQISLHPNKLSWLINDRTDKNFNEYINSFRLEIFKEKALNPSNKHLTLLGLAYESGFSSKTVFNAFFKKVEGMTPRKWLSSQ